MTESGGTDLPDHLITILDHIRRGDAQTRPELERASGLSRKIVAQRVDYLLGAGLIEEGELGVSTGGRMPRLLRLRASAGSFLVAELNSSSVSAAITDLSGAILAQRDEPCDVLAEPGQPLALVETLFDSMLEEGGSDVPPMWGVSIGVLLPVDSRSGRPVHMPMMPKWGDYPIAERFQRRYGIPAWVENEVNLMALGELGAGLGKGVRDFVFVKIGGGIGAGIVVNGRLHRGAQGAAGEIGHITVTDDPDVVCWCGNTGCLMQIASSAAIARVGQSLAETGASPALAELAQTGAQVSSSDVVDAASAGDKASLEVILAAGRSIGIALAGLVNTFNPTSIFLGGTIASGSDVLLASVRKTIYERALPMSTRELEITFSPLSVTAGLVGGAVLALDNLFSPAVLRTWIEAGAPVLAEGRRSGAEEISA